MQRLEIYLQGVPVGHLEHDHDARAVLHYDAAWIGRPDRVSLSLSLPPPTRRHTTPAVRHFFDALLPDNTDVRTRWGRELGVDGRDLFALLGAVGGDLPGAVQLLPSGAALPNAGGVDWLSEAELARVLRQLRDDATAWIPDLAHGAFSLAGAQRKTALIQKGGRWGCARGSTPTTHILKTGVSGLAAQVEVEHLCLRLATQLGLRTAASTLLRAENEVALVIERFDRERVAGGVVRLHHEDGCQALGRDPARRYRSEGGPQAAEIAAVLWHSATRPDVEVKRFADALILQWLIGGTDAHARNYSVQHSVDGVRLAPLYDVASILPYLTDGARPKLAMAIGGTTDLFAIDASHLASEGRALKLHPAWILGRAEELALALPTAIEAAVAETTPLPGSTSMTARLAECLLERQRDCLNRLTTPGGRPTRSAA